MSKTIAIIDYGSGNIRSASKAFSYISDTERLGYDIRIESSPAGIARADKIVLPGQGAFANCMSNLRSIDGMIETLEEKVLRYRTPFFGICVGMQLLADRGLEHGTHTGLGWISGDVIPLQQTHPGLKIPHMGWNEIIPADQDHYMLRSIKSADSLQKHFYFVHSFMFQLKDKQHLLAHAEYGQEIAAIIAKDNIFGTQFHPEKSQNAGLNLIRDFLKWTP
jgi:glutamine amidotransferase